MKKISLKNLLIVSLSAFMLQGLISCNSAQKKAAPEEKVLLRKNLSVFSCIR